MIENNEFLFAIWQRSKDFDLPYHLKIILWRHQYQRIRECMKVGERDDHENSYIFWQAEIENLSKQIM